MLELGRRRSAAGWRGNLYACPHIGIPQHSQIAPHAIRPQRHLFRSRTESAFDARQVIGERGSRCRSTRKTGRDTAKGSVSPDDLDRMGFRARPTTRRGAPAETQRAVKGIWRLAHHDLLLATSRPGGFREWVKQFGDPRNSKVDPVVWVVSIPLSATRTYVQAFMENLLVYRVVLRRPRKRWQRPNSHRVTSEERIQPP